MKPDSREWEIQYNINHDQRLRERLEKLNKGCNFFTLNPENRPFRIEVKLEVNLNIEGSEEWIQVSSDLPTDTYGYGFQGYDEGQVQKFLKELSQWAESPFYTPKNIHREHKLSKWDMNDSIDYRQKTIRISDVQIIVYDMAKEALKRMHGIEDFAEEVARILGKQRKATEAERKAIDRWVYLQESILCLEKAVKPRNDYGYGYGMPVDKTNKLVMVKAEYKKKMKAIEKEMDKLAGKHSFLKREQDNDDDS